jgi:hypothetical protein
MVIYTAPEKVCGEHEQPYHAQVVPQVFYAGVAMVFNLFRLKKNVAEFQARVNAGGRPRIWFR